MILTSTVTWVDVVSAIWPIIAAIFGVIVTGIIYYFSGQAKYVKRVSDLETEVAVLKTEVNSLNMVTGHLTRTGEDIKKELGSLTGDIREIKTGIAFILEKFHNQ